MEYRRAYWDEYPDRYLVERHEREIFPLLRQRYLFADVKEFLLYDFYALEGFVNEDVFAFSNRVGDKRSLVVYHNKYAVAKGWIRSSVAYSVKTGPAGERSLVQKNLGEGLGLDNDPARYVIFRDQFTGLEYIRSSRELFEKGLYAELEAYKCHVFLDFHQVIDNEWHQYAQLTEYLNGRGVPNIEEALKEIFLQPVHYPFRELVNAGMFRWIIQNRVAGPTFDGQNYQTALEEVEGKTLHLLQEIKQLIQGQGDETDIAAGLRQKLEVILQLPALDHYLSKPDSPEYTQALEYLSSKKEDDPLVWGTMLGWLFTHNLGAIAGSASPDSLAEVSRSWIDEWLFGKILAGALHDLGIDDASSWRAVALIKILVMHTVSALPAAVKDKTKAAASSQAYRLLETWLRDSEVQRFIGVNRYQDVLWFNKESFDNLAWWMFTVQIIEICANPALTPDEAGKAILACYDLIQHIRQAEDASGFQVEKLLNAVK